MGFFVFVFGPIVLNKSDNPVNSGLLRENVAKSVLPGSITKNCGCGCEFLLYPQNSVKKCLLLHLGLECSFLFSLNLLN